MRLTLTQAIKLPRRNTPEAAELAIPCYSAVEPLRRSDGSNSSPCVFIRL
jgi:hypothetical protein